MSFLNKLFGGSKHDTAAIAAGIAHASPDTAVKTVSEIALSTYQKAKVNGAALIEAGDLNGAKHAYQVALEQAPDSSEAHLNLGFVLYELAQLDEAKVQFDEAIRLDSDNFDANLLCAMVALAQDDTQSALFAVNQALKVDPNSDHARGVLYKTLALQGNFEAIEERVRLMHALPETDVGYHLAIAKAMSGVAVDGEPKNNLLRLARDHLDAAVDRGVSSSDALYDLSLILLALKESDSAISTLKKVIQLFPNHKDAAHTLAVVLTGTGDQEAALDVLEKLVIVQPRHEAARTSIGTIHMNFGRFDKALESFRAALNINPDQVGALMLQGNVQAKMGLFDLAMGSSNRAISISPDTPELHFSLGNILSFKGEHFQAVEAYKQALKLRPAYLEARINYASALLNIGEAEAARSTYQECLIIQPNNLTTLSNAAYCASFDPSCTSMEYLEAARAYGAVVSKLATPFTTWRAISMEDRPLRVGFVSADFCFHPVGLFLESVMACIDPEKLELHAFSNGTVVDFLQESLKARFSSWTSIVGLSDQAAAASIYKNQLDLLIDLSGFTGDNRLSLFAWRPAPVQASWLGYWASTGVAEIDYILGDAHSVPLENHHQFSEKVRYLPHIRYCFSPPSTVYGLPVSKPPAVRNKYITFGSYQNIKKLTPSVVSLWGRIFKLVPKAKFRLQGASYLNPNIRSKLFDQLAAVGIPESKVQLVDSMDRLEYLMSHAEVDIILDTFPYTGGTTTCDALWMGVPTVTLAGNSMLSRQGVTLLMCANLSDWIAKTEDDYVTIAVSKTKDIANLAQLRKQLRDQLFESPIFNAPKFAHDFHRVLESMVREKYSALNLL